MRLLRTENGRFPFGKEKTAPQNSDRIRMDCTETLQLRHGSSLK